MTELVDASQYCRHLINPPNVGVQYQNYSKFYLCKFTEKPCIARRIDDVSKNSDVFSYFSPSINQNELESCPARNVSDEVAKAIVNDGLERKILELREKKDGL